MGYGATPVNPLQTRPMGDETTNIRDAASLLLLKSQPGVPPSVLMGMRNAGHKFLPNKLVFPGGRVDAGDAAAPLASPLPPAALDMLGRAATPEQARGLGHAAARELEEETGLSLGTPPELHSLEYLCRAVTPPFSPIRFNARFFVAPETAVHGALAGSGELEGLAWYAIDAALALDLGLATRSVLEQLQLWLAMDEAARASRKLPVFMNAQWQYE
jgi:8-oxo-dGTP pyrophosphatase MutT (NUDIX family)